MEEWLRDILASSPTPMPSASLSSDCDTSVSSEHSSQAASEEGSYSVPSTRNDATPLLSPEALGTWGFGETGANMSLGAVVDADAAMEMQRLLDLLPLVQQPDGGVKFDFGENIGGEYGAAAALGLELNGGGVDWDFLPSLSSPTHASFSGLGVF